MRGECLPSGLMPGELDGEPPPAQLMASAGARTKLPCCLGLRALRLIRMSFRFLGWVARGA